MLLTLSTRQCRYRLADLQTGKTMVRKLGAKEFYGPHLCRGGGGLRDYLFLEIGSANTIPEMSYELDSI